jgi:hypothetical protein
MPNQIASRPAHEALDACHELEYLLLGDLRELLEEPETLHTRRSLMLILEHLLVNLPRQLMLKCEGGYMTEVLGEFPWWQDEVEALLSEDQACNSALVQLHERLAHELPWLPIAAEVRATLDRWMELLAAIRKQENRLLQKAFTLDLGGEA